MINIDSSTAIAASPTTPPRGYYHYDYPPPPPLSHKLWSRNEWEWNGKASKQASKKIDGKRKNFHQKLFNSTFAPLPFLPSSFVTATLSLSLSFESFTPEESSFCERASQLELVIIPTRPERGATDTRRESSSSGGQRGGGRGMSLIEITFLESNFRIKVKFYATFPSFFISISSFYWNVSALSAQFEWFLCILNTHIITKERREQAGERGKKRQQRQWQYCNVMNVNLDLFDIARAMEAARNGEIPFHPPCLIQWSSSSSYATLLSRKNVSNNDMAERRGGKSNICLSTITKSFHRALYPQKSMTITMTTTMKSFSVSLSLCFVFQTWQFNFRPPLLRFKICSNMHRIHTFEYLSVPVSHCHGRES